MFESQLSRVSFAGWLLSMAAVAPQFQAAAAGQTVEFRVSDPIVCKTVEGLRNYIRREPPELTTYDKLVVYVEPTGFETRSVQGKRKAHFVQNGKVRAAGSKKFIFERAELVKFEPEVLGPGATFYLVATVGFKNMPPGDYVLELETVDEAAEPDRTVTQTIPFRIVKDAGEEKPETRERPSRTNRKTRDGQSG